MNPGLYYWQMSKKNILLLLVAIFWLVNGSFCFCHEETVVGSHEKNPVACAHETSAPLEGSPDECGSCCGHLVFTLEILAGSFGLPSQESFAVEILTSSEQLHFRSIYHPPKA